MKKHSRKTDITGRVGGEEFAMILPYTDIDNSLILANRIREEVAMQTITLNEVDINFTVSIGLTALCNDDTSIDCAFARADSALYSAKENGRNRVEKK